MPRRRRAQAWRYSPAYRRPRHFHDEPELNLVLQGSGVFALGEHEHRVSAGTVLWFPPGLDHYLVSASEDFDLFVVGFQPQLLRAYAREHGVVPSFARAPQRLPVAIEQRLGEQLMRVPQSADDLSVEQHLLRLLRNTSDAPAASPTTARSHDLGYRAAAVLLAHPDAGRDELARRLASNRGDVSRRFRKQQGLSLCDYKNRLRVLRLLRCLDAGTSNLMRAALDAGFGSYAQCHRAFRSLLGASPRDYLCPELRSDLADRFDPVQPPAADGHQ